MLPSAPPALFHGGSSSTDCPRIFLEEVGGSSSTDGPPGYMQRCPAVKSAGPLCYANFYGDAGWRYQMTPTDAYVSSVGRLSPLAKTRGWRVSMIRHDLMHGLFLGSAGKLVGSVVRELVGAKHSLE